MIYKSVFAVSLLASSCVATPDIVKAHAEAKDLHRAQTKDNHRTFTKKPQANRPEKLKKSKHQFSATNKKGVQTKLQKGLPSLYDRVSQLHKDSNVHLKRDTAFDSATVVDTEEAQSLRGLKQKVRDNFLSYQYYTDRDCNDFAMAQGSLVNNCFNLKDGSSYLIKMAKKAKTIVQLDYEGQNCRGVPIRVTDMVKDGLPFTEFDDCVNTYYDQLGFSYSVNYLTTYPTTEDKWGAAYIVEGEPDLCDKNGKYFQFVAYKENTCVSLSGAPGIYMATDSCPSALHYRQYMTADCSGDPVEEVSVPASMCFTDDDDDDDGNYVPTCTECEEYSWMASEGCFAGDDSLGACVSCGYYEAPSMSSDCIACEDGYEIDVVYSDCTGKCVPVGTASLTIADSTCEYSCAQCGYPYHDQSDNEDCPAACASSTFTGDTCFQGDSNHGACDACGFYDSAGDAGNPDDCVSCPDGYEIDVVYGDCTGYCVPAGTAATPLDNSDCKMPCAPCGTYYDGWLDAPPSENGKDDDDVEQDDDDDDDDDGFDDAATQFLC